MLESDHAVIVAEISKRLEKTDKKIDKISYQIDELRKEQHEYSIKTAVLETQMSGVVKFVLLVVGAGVSIITYLLKQGI